MSEYENIFAGIITRTEREHVSSGRTADVYSIFYESGDIVQINSLGTVYAQVGNNSKTLTNCYFDRNLLTDLDALAQGADVTYEQVENTISRAKESCLSERSRY